MIQRTLYWFICSDPECDADPNFKWGSENSEPDREWCVCGSADTPILVGSEPLIEWEKRVKLQQDSEKSGSFYGIIGLSPAGQWLTVAPGQSHSCAP